MKIYNRIKNKMSNTQYIAVGFAIIIFLGALLLMLPVSTKPGESTDFFSALFTAVSATCVTGLVQFDTYTHWTIFGQLIILFMIQIGGLGFITIGVTFAVILKRRVSLRDRGLLQESVNTMEYGGILKLTKKIVLGTALVEGLGAIILAIRFAFDMPIGEAIYYGIFHSVSAFCNGGFDLFGKYEKFSSLSIYAYDFTVIVTVSLLILIGGIGFAVWDDVTRFGIKLRKYSLHSKIVLSATLFLLIIPTFLFWIFERNNLFIDLSIKEAFLASLFSGVTARTAGFNSVDTGALSNASVFLTIIMMFIGGCSGSTAGGVKVTTIFVLLVFLWSNIKGQYGISVFNRRLKEDAIKKATLVLSINLALSFIGIITIMGFNPEIGFSDVFFEVFSAIDTVGMTTGITRDLATGSKMMLMILMYLGRIGSLSFALSFTDKRTKAPVLLPAEDISIG